MQDLHTANKVIQKVKGQEVARPFPTDFDHTACRIVTFTDASFVNLPDRGSQGAYVTFLCDKYGSYCLLAWQSRRIRRVVNSTKAAECLAAVKASDASIALSYMLSAMLFSDDECRIPISILSDSKSLVDSVHSSTAVENKRQQIDISLLRDTVQQQQISEFRWVPTSLQVVKTWLLHEVPAGHNALTTEIWFLYWSFCVILYFITIKVDMYMLDVTVIGCFVMCCILFCVCFFLKK